MCLEVVNICARKSKFFKLSLKKLCWFLVFCYVFGVSLCPTKSEAIGGGRGGRNGKWSPTDTSRVSLCQLIVVGKLPIWLQVAVLPPIDLDLEAPPLLRWLHALGF
jgi:hypothetical protein